MKVKKINFILIMLFFFLIIFFLQASTQNKIQTFVPALKEVFANDFTIGCLLSYKHIGFPDDPAVPGQSAIVAPEGGTLIKFHMNSMSPGNNMKSIYTVDIAASAQAYDSASGTQRDSVETHPIVRFNGDLIAQLNWAKRNNFTFRGHTLVWHSQTPPELFRSGYKASGDRLTKEVMPARMENYIHEVIRLIHENWPGLLSAMDVVNEAIDDNGNIRSSGNEWYATFGDETYIMKAFEFARKYTVMYNENQIKLYYNDYETSVSKKADGIVKLCKPVYEAGFLDGIGMQEHDTSLSPTAENWINSYNKFYPICNEMTVTELDISTTSGTNYPTTSVLQTQANQYAMLFKCFVERSYKSGRGKIINVSKDGLNDRFTFVTNQSSSLWDANSQCKLSFWAVVDVGKNYNELVSLISKTEKLKKSNFSVKKREEISSSLIPAKNALNRNYSASESAVKGLEDAIKNLKSVLKIK